jgi:uncharacterized membrane protein YdbT with pleckstrin-like domain
MRCVWSGALCSVSACIGWVLVMLQTVVLIFLVLFLLGVVPGAVLNLIMMALISLLVYEFLKSGRN